MIKLTTVCLFCALGSVIANNDKALWDAAKIGNVDDVQNALARGENPNWNNPKDRNKWTALHVACRYNHPAVVSKLLDAGASKDLMDRRGLTPLFLAASYNLPEVAKVLLDSGADPNVQENINEIIGMTPLYVATKENYIDVVKILLEGGADPDIPRYDVLEGYTPLFEAAYKGNLVIVKALVDAHANVRLSADDGSTALHAVTRGSMALASKNDQHAIARILLRKGADVKKKNNNGITPSDMARFYDESELANIIESYSGPYDLTTTTTPIYDLYLLSCGVTVLIAETLYVILN